MITKFITIAIISFIVTNCDNKTFGQQCTYDSLPKLDSLLTILHQSDSLQLNAELQEYKHTYRFSLWYLAPSVGFNVVSNKPTLIFNTSNIVSYFQNRRVIERKLISMQSKADLQLKNNTIKLITTYNDLKSSILQLSMIFETYKKYEQLYQLKVQQNKANEINSETFLKEQIAFSERKKVVLSSIDFINEKFTTIELMLNTKIFEYLTYDSYLNGH